MRAALCLAAALVAVSGVPALAGERQVLCSGQASGTRGDRVDVSIYVDADGKQIGSYASWDPPLSGPQPASAADAPDLTFTIMYHEAGAGGLGAAGHPMIIATALAPPGKKRRGNPERQLAGLGLELSVDQSAAQPLELRSDPRIMPLPMIATRYADAPALPEGARTVSLKLIDSRKRTVGGVSYDLTDTATRDRLFAAAWQAAQAATVAPDGCEQTMESPE